MTYSIYRAVLSGCASLLLTEPAAAQTRESTSNPTQAAAPSGRSYTVDDMLAAEALGKASIDPSGRRVVFERLGAYEDAVRFDVGAFVRRSTSVLWVADVSGGEARPLLSPSEGRGLMIGAWSPSGDRLLIHRLRHDSWDAGVVELATGTVRWLDLFPEIPAFGRTFQWRGDEEIIAIHRPSGGLPDQAGSIVNAFEAARQRQLEASAGRLSRTRLGAGAFAEMPLASSNMIVSINVETGVRRTLATGRFFDLELSPDGRWMAGPENGATPSIDLARPVLGLERPQDRRLHLIDVSSGTLNPVCRDCNIASGVMTWSPDSAHLLVWERTGSGPLDGRLLALTPGENTIEPFDLGDLEPELDVDAGYLDVIEAAWLDGHPLVRARTLGTDRPDWWSLQKTGPRNLTTAIPGPPGRLEALTAKEARVIADGRVWRLTTDRNPTPLTPADLALASFSEPDPMSSARLRVNDPVRGVEFVLACSHGWLTGSERPDCGPVNPSVRRSPVSASPTVVLERLPHGHAARLELRQGTRRRQLTTLNEDLAGIALASPILVPHAMADGAAVNSWLYLPPANSAGPHPVVMIIYPGRPRPPQTEPFGLEAEANIQLFAAAGYAVIVASVPRPADLHNPAVGLGDLVVSVLDAVLTQRPELDGNRVALVGHSFGGYSALVTATQTDRFRSIIAAASTSDLSAAWGESSALNRADPRNGPSRRHRIGQVETGFQVGLGGPPWTYPDRYVRNSPLFAADQINAPVLLIHGDFDMIPISQAELMFTALWRQNKDARLLTYWGEGHSIDTPANIRDLHYQEIDWLARTLGDADLNWRSPGAPSGAPKPPPGGPG